MFVEEMAPVIVVIAVGIMALMIGINLILNVILSHRIKNTYQKIKEIEKKVEIYIDEVTKNEEIIMENEVAKAENSLISSVLAEIFP